MNRSIIYAKTKEFLKGRWLRIILILLMTSYVFSIITGALTMKGLFEFLSIFSMDSFYYMDEGYIVAQFFRLISSMFTLVIPLVFIFGVLKEVLENSLNIEIKNAYLNDEEIGVNSTLKITKRNFFQLLLFSFLKAVIIGIVITGLFLIVFFISMIFGVSEMNQSLDYYSYYYTYESQSSFNILSGIVSLLIYGGGFLCTLYVTYGLKYVPFIIDENKGIELFSAVKRSLDLTKGEKLNLFILELRYAIRIYIPFIVMFILMMPAAIFQSEVLILVLFFLGIIGTMIISVYYMPHIRASMAIYYVESQNYNDDDERDTYEEVIITEDVEEEILEESENIVVTEEKNDDSENEEIDEDVEESVETTIDETTTFMDL